MSITNGVYRICHFDPWWNNESVAHDGEENGTECWYGNGGSKSMLSTSLLPQYDNQNGSCVRLDTTSGKTKVKFAPSLLMADIMNGNMSQGNALWLYKNQTDAGSALAQQWYFNDTYEDNGTQAYGTQSFNGVSYPLCKVFSAKNYDADPMCCGLATDSNAYLIIQHPDQSEDHQLWFLVKDSYWDKNLPVPTKIGAAIQVESDESFNGYQTTDRIIYEQGMTSFTPGWICTGRFFQVRYRYCGRNRAGVDNVTKGAWSNWLSVANNSTTNADNGWGNAWSYNVDCNDTGSTNDNVKRGWEIPISFDTSTYDMLDFTIDVRRWDTKNYGNGFVGGHGTRERKYHFRIYVKPNVIITAAEYTPVGLQITYSSDITRSNNSITFSNITYGGKKFCEDVTIENAPYTGTVTIPLSDTYLVPVRQNNNNPVITMDYSLTTVDGVTSDYVGEDVEVTYGDGGLTLDFTQMVDGNNVVGSFGADYDTEAVILVYQNDGKWQTEPCEKIPGTGNNPGTYRILPPLNVDYSLIVMAVDDANDNWAINEIQGTIVNSIEYVWNWDDEEVSMWVFFDQFGVLTNDYTRSTNSYKLNGRDFDSVFYDTSSTSNMRIVGAVPLTQDKFGEQLDDLNDFFRLRRADYALFRDPEGGRYHVAILTMNRERHDIEFYKVTLTMREYS